EPILDQGEVLVDVGEELSHRHGDTGLPAQDLEVADVFRREGVFQEEKVVPLKLLGQVDGVDGGNALVDIVKQLHPGAELAAEVLKQLQDGVHVGSGFPYRLLAV